MKLLAELDKKKGIGLVERVKQGQGRPTKLAGQIMKVKVQLKKVDESGRPLAGAVFVVLRDGKVIQTTETEADGTITVSNVTEGYYEFREVEAPAGFDKDSSPVILKPETFKINEVLRCNCRLIYFL